MLRCLLAGVLLCGFCCTVVAAQNQGKTKKKAATPAPAPTTPAATPAGEAASDDEDSDKNIPRVVPVFDPGSHTRLIRALGFNASGSRLVTVGEDSSIQIWSTATGERVDILRLPSFGHEQGYRSAPWDVAAISRDASLVAIGGKKSANARMFVVDIAKRAVIPALEQAATAAAFSGDGRLAVGIIGRGDERTLRIFSDITEKEPVIRRRSTITLKATGVRSDITYMAFSPDNTRLVASTNRELFVWNITHDEPKLLGAQRDLSVTNALAWSPDGKQFARCYYLFGNAANGLEIRREDGTLASDHPFADKSGISRRGRARGVNYLSPDELLITCDDGEDESRDGSTAVAYNIGQKTGRVVVSVPEAAKFHVIGAVSADRKLAAINTSMGMDAIVVRIGDGKQVARCGAASPVPTLVGWSKAAKAPALAWSESHTGSRFIPQAADLQFAFDLATMTPMGQFDTTQFHCGSMTQGAWTLRRSGPNSLKLFQEKKPIGDVLGGNSIEAATLIPRDGEPPWIAWAATLIEASRTNLTISKSDGSLVVKPHPKPVATHYLVSSPDGRFLLVPTGTHRLCVFAVDAKQPFPLMSFARANGEWVAWSGHGYYTASPGGEKMFGWAESHGPKELATFHPAEKFAKHFRRPDLLKRAIELGSWDAALKVIETRAPQLDEILPPRAQLKLLKQTGAKVQLQASATSSVKDKPVVSMRLLIDGRPLSAGIGYRSVPAGAKAEATWDIEIPSGPHELKLLARNDENSAVSEPVMVVGPKSVSQQPVLHRLCVGINAYQNSALNLTSAVKDATDVFAGLEQYCVGSNNRFGRARGLQLLNQQATRGSILKALSDIREAAKPGDLVVFLFAGHGVKQKEEYYLLTHEADPSQSLTGKSLSGEDLRQALVGMECPVLLMMDACHSARGVKSFRPATDDLTRSLTDDDAGVTVLAAAMAHEVASATEENGHFTAAFLKALKLGQGVPFDAHDHLLYTHHIYSVVFSEVRKATNGLQNPFLNMPWTAPPLAIREVPK